jgi:hypothetical protein
MSELVINFSKENTLPATFTPSTLYLIKSTNSSLFDLYLSSADGTGIRHIVRQDEIQAMIDSSFTEITNLISSIHDVKVVADITQRNALTPTRTTLAFVVDATGDSTVMSGSASYVYDTSGSQWHKMTEYESMDVVQQYANLVGKPTSSVAAIDSAVSASHTHANKNLLDSLGLDVNNRLTLNGSIIPVSLVKEEW